MAGLILTGAGVSAIGGAIAALVEQDRRRYGGAMETASWPAGMDVGPIAGSMIGIGVAATAVGIPLWASGARTWEGDVEERDARQLRHVGGGVYRRADIVMGDNNPTMAGWGKGLSISGFATLGLGGALVSGAVAEKDLGVAITAFGTLMMGTLLVLPGVPLWIAGEYDVPMSPGRSTRARVARASAEHLGRCGIIATRRELLMRCEWLFAVAVATMGCSADDGFLPSTPTVR